MLVVLVVMPALQKVTWTVLYSKVVLYFFLLNVAATYATAQALAEQIGVQGHYLLATPK